MYVPKTQENDSDVIAFLDGFKSEVRFPDLMELLEIQENISGEKAKMWGSSIIGFGKYSYKGKSSAGDWFKIGFSPRKQNISIYAISGFEKETELLSALGKYKTGKGCLYVKRLADTDKSILTEFLTRSWEEMKTW